MFKEFKATGGEQRIVKLGSKMQLRVHKEDGMRHWALVIRWAGRKAESRIDLPDLGDPDELQLELAMDTFEHCFPCELTLRALPSLARRPSDYGRTRQEIEDARARGDVEAIVGMLPVDVKVGRAKVAMNSDDVRVAGIALSKQELTRRLVLALSAEPAETKVLSARLPRELYRRLEIEALQRLVSPGQLISQLLQERYRQG